MIIVNKKKTLHDRLNDVDQKLATSEGRQRDLMQQNVKTDPKPREDVEALSFYPPAQNDRIISNNYQITPITNGHYKVIIDLSKWLHKHELRSFTQVFRQISSKDIHFSNLCSLKGFSLEYKSESLFPDKYDQRKEKVMIVLGNPATHSVANGMFFYSRGDGSRHQFWRKLEEAGLIKCVRPDTREEEAKERKKLILDGKTSENYLLGLTTFYSFPTPVIDNYEFSNVVGVLKLFNPKIKLVNIMESKRISDYPFTNDATLVFVQKDSCNAFKKNISGLINSKFKRVLYWPAVSRKNGDKSSGKYLLELLSNSNSQC